MTASVGSVVAYRLVSNRRLLRGTLAVGTLNPVFWMLSISLGLGALAQVPSGSGARSYVEFVGPGLLVVTSAGTAMSEAIWPVLNDFNWRGSFRAMAATSLLPRQICLGHISWMMLRLLVEAGVFLAVLALLGGTTGLGAMLCLPLAVLNGMACAVPLLAVAAGVEARIAPFAVFFRLGVLPMFLFSGAFFPVDRLPWPVQLVAWVLPMSHGVAAARRLAAGVLDGPLAVHVVVLAVWAGLATMVAVRRFARRLETT